ncbi:MAG: lysophospholipid acyltransferase family protein [Paracoccaceae bacterium]
MADEDEHLKHRIKDTLARGLLGATLYLPYAKRVRLVGWVVSKCVAPLAGWRRRVLNNLAYVAPEMSDKEARAVADKVCNNVGRALIEIYSGDEFIERATHSEIGGPGQDALEQARKDGRPCVLITAHLGNYDVVRAKLSRDGFPMAALYRPMDNEGFNAHYVNAISKVAAPVYPTDKRGITSLVRHLKDGGNIGIVADVGATNAPLLEFYGKPAHTPLSAAEWALKYDALLIPVFGIRKLDGLNFRVHVSDPIPHTTPEIMMQAYNDTVEGIVRTHINQWFWVHRRWKLGQAEKDTLSADAQPPK